jgi:hypothetical protein
MGTTWRFLLYFLILFWASTDVILVRGESVHSTFDIQLSCYSNFSWSAIKHFTSIQTQIWCKYFACIALNLISFYLLAYLTLGFWSYHGYLIRVTGFSHATSCDNLSLNSNKRFNLHKSKHTHVIDNVFYISY